MRSSMSTAFVWLTVRGFCRERMSSCRSVTRRLWSIACRAASENAVSVGGFAAYPFWITSSRAPTLRWRRSMFA
eukprot:5729534-Heterocapsa_arctica.AAC.1